MGSEYAFQAPITDVAWAALLTAVLVLGADRLVESGPALLMLATALFAVMAGLVIRYWPANRDFGWANRATLLRGSLVITLISLAPFVSQLGNGLWLYGALCLLALILDGVDGTIARKTRTQTAFGARFDMELDALFILGLCGAVLALGKTGPWVLALGLMRYGFVIAALILPFLNQPLPESFRRKTVCVWQVATLMVAVLPITSPVFASWTLAAALVLLIHSFVTDVRWLYHRRIPT
ncbi:MAG: CDP-alcohol phosphatidyltransferase family protein [Pseudomonadota bacterium]